MVDVEESRVVHTCMCVRARVREREEESNASDARRDWARGEEGRRRFKGSAERTTRVWKKEGRDPGNATESRGGRRGNYGSFLTCERCA